MAYFKNGKYFTPDQSGDFDKVHNPGVPTPYSGIYRCEVCGREAVSTKNHPLPPEHHAANMLVPHQPTRWRLIAASHPV